MAGQELWEVWTLLILERGKEKLSAKNKKSYDANVQRNLVENGALKAVSYFALCVFVQCLYSNEIRSIAVVKFSSSDSSDDNGRQDENFPAEAGPSNVGDRRGYKQCFTERVLSALDKCKVTDRDAVGIMIAAAEAFGRDPQQYTINRTSLRRCRRSNRENMLSYVKDNPEVRSHRFICSHSEFLFFNAFHSSPACRS